VDATGERLVTKSDFKEPISDLKDPFARLRADVGILKWMMGFMLAAIVAILFMLIRR
jgi:hypothetical protein